MAKKKATQKTTIGKVAADQARVAKTRLDASGKTSRVKGHVSARTRRSQAKRDSKNPHG